VFAPQRTQLLLTFGYDGGRFRGVTLQPDQPTAAAALKQRFLDAGVLPKALNFASRTDAGVHARRNIATCWLRGTVDLEAVIAAVNLPRDDGLREVEVHEVPIHVHARAISCGKHYRYVIDDGWGPGPPTSSDGWCVAPVLDLLAMQRGAAHLIGEHDFASFCARRSKNRQDPRREISSIVIHAAAIPGPGKRIIFDIRGKSFLRHMVRIMVGTLAVIGGGLRRPEEMADILAARRRGAAGPTAPAHGLTLIEVFSTWPLPPLTAP
jgi:tRNA pseudouridine38-40 synthase